MPLPESFLLELRARSEIEGVVSQYVNLRRRGRNLVGLCPFHGEKTPSFTLYPETNSFYCFGCAAAGDSITFIRRVENLDYLEAVRFLAERCGLPMPEEQVDDGRSKMRSKILEMNREAARFFHAALSNAQGAAGSQYFAARGLKPATVRHFGLGFAPDSWDTLLNHLIKKGYSPEEAVLADLAVARRSGGAYDKFRGRVIFPIIDLRGNVVAFGGRVLDDKKPKYLNTADTMVYKKTNHLFAMNFAKSAKDGFIILAEGYMDVIAMFEAGYNNAVAALGTALTGEQARLIARYVGEVVIAGDSDEAGQKAVNRDIDILRSAGLKVRLFNAQGGKDPDEFIRTNGPERFRILLDASGNDVEYRLNLAKDGLDFNTTEGKYEYASRAARVLLEIDDAIERELYLAKLATELGISKDSIQQRLREMGKKKRRSSMRTEFREVQKQTAGWQDTVNPERGRFPRAARAEETIIAILLVNPDLIEKIRAKIGPDDFITSFNRRVFEAVHDAIAAGIEDVSTILAEIGSRFNTQEMSAISGIAARRIQLGHDIRPGLGTDVWVELDDCMESLLQEKEKQKEKDVAGMDSAEFAEFTRKLAEQKKKG